MLGTQELIMILLIVVVVFGAKRIPEIMEGLGKGVKSFKKAMDGEELDKAISSPQPAPAPSTGAHADSSPAEVVTPEKIEPK
jgi:sec-independent protein translocase protein TatA